MSVRTYQEQGRGKGLKPQLSGRQANSQKSMSELISRVTLENMVQLQRTIGNRACRRMLSTEPDDNPVHPAQVIIRPPGDIYEQEADRLAGLALQNDNAASATLAVPAAADPAALCLKDGNAIFGLRSGIDAARGGGQPLSGDFRARMEQSFGMDLGRVRLHADSSADELNRAIGARAFTTGTDIFFRQGEYNSESGEGQRILAHEITHVVQQTGWSGGENPSSSGALAVVQGCWKCSKWSPAEEDQELIQLEKLEEWHEVLDGRLWYRKKENGNYFYKFCQGSLENYDEFENSYCCNKWGDKKYWEEQKKILSKLSLEFMYWVPKPEIVTAEAEPQQDPVPEQNESCDEAIKFDPNPQGPQALWDFERFDIIFEKNYISGACNALVPLWFADLIHPTANKPGICDANFRRVMYVKNFLDSTSLTHQDIPSGVFMFHVLNFFRANLLDLNWFESLTWSKLAQLSQKFDVYSDQHSWRLVRQKVITGSIFGLYPQCAPSSEQALTKEKIAATIAWLLQKAGYPDQNVSGLIELKASDKDGTNGKNHCGHEMGIRFTGNNAQLYDQNRGVVNGLAEIEKFIFEAYIVHPFENTDRATLIFWFVADER